MTTKLNYHNDDCVHLALVKALLRVSAPMSRNRILDDLLRVDAIIDVWSELEKEAQSALKKKIETSIQFSIDVALGDFGKCDAESRYYDDGSVHLEIVRGVLN